MKEVTRAIILRELRARHLSDSPVAFTEPITEETAARLAAAFGTSPQFWLNLEQADPSTVATT